jgi:hypothetical protein
MKQIILILGIVFLIGCTQPAEIKDEDPKMSAFLSCMKDEGVKMYGTYICSVCKKQRALFGESFEHLGEIECHPRGENPQTQLCLEKDIQKTPTWTLEKDGKVVGRLEGFQNIETLSEFSGCTME